MLNIYAWGPLVSEKFIFYIFSSLHFFIFRLPEAWPVWTPGLDWQDLCRGPLNIATYKYVISGPHGFREDNFLKFFSYIALYKHTTPGVWPAWAAGA